MDQQARTQKIFFALSKIMPEYYKDLSQVNRKRISAIVKDCLPEYPREAFLIETMISQGLLEIVCNFAAKDEVEQKTAFNFILSRASELGLERDATRDILAYVLKVQSVDLLKFGYEDGFASRLINNYTVDSLDMFEKEFYRLGTVAVDVDILLRQGIISDEEGLFLFEDVTDSSDWSDEIEGFVSLLIKLTKNQDIIWENNIKVFEENSVEVNCYSRVVNTGIRIRSEYKICNANSVQNITFLYLRNFNSFEELKYTSVDIRLLLEEIEKTDSCFDYHKVIEQQRKTVEKRMLSGMSEVERAIYELAATNTNTFCLEQLKKNAQGNNANKGELLRVITKATEEDCIKWIRHKVFEDENEAGIIYIAKTNNVGMCLSVYLEENALMTGFIKKASLSFVIAENGKLGAPTEVSDSGLIVAIERQDGIDYSIVFATRLRKMNQKRITKEKEFVAGLTREEKLSYEASSSKKNIFIYVKENPEEFKTPTDGLRLTADSKIQIVDRYKALVICSNRNLLEWRQSISEDNNTLSVRYGSRLFDAGVALSFNVEYVDVETYTITSPVLLYQEGKEFQLNKKVALSARKAEELANAIAEVNPALAFWGVYKSMAKRYEDNLRKEEQKRREEEKRLEKQRLMREEAARIAEIEAKKKVFDIHNLFEKTGVEPIPDSTLYDLYFENKKAYEQIRREQKVHKDLAKFLSTLTAKLEPSRVKILYSLSNSNMYKLLEKDMLEATKLELLSWTKKTQKDRNWEISGRVYEGFYEGKRVCSVYEYKHQFFGEAPSELIALLRKITSNSEP